MAIPSLLINTFVKQNEKSDIDTLSKIFVVVECAFGLNRCAILGVKRIVFTILFIYAVLVNVFLVWYNSQHSKFNYILFLMIVKYTQYLICGVLSFLTWRRIRDFYCGLEKFDNEIGYRPKVTWQSCRMCGQVVMVTISTLFVYMYNGYYAHMLNLLTTRLRILNEGLESSLKSASNRVDERKVKIKMERLMEIYSIVIMAHTKLTNGIKWQLLLILTTSFIFVLGFCYRISVDVIREHTSMTYTIVRSTLSVVEFIPVFAPCLCSDQLKAEVQRLKQLLADKLYEGGISKPSRRSARTLLALMETRDLSFPLLRMVDISISLPFKFTSLLVTYLIILLQFEKVFNPSKQQNKY